MTHYWLAGRVIGFTRQVQLAGRTVASTTIRSLL